MSKVSVGRTRGGTIRFENKQQALDSPILPRAKKEVEFSESKALHIVKHSQVEYVPAAENSPSSVLENNFFAFGGSCQGWRRDMEDALVVFPLTSAVASCSQPHRVLSLLLDGHRGKSTVEVVAQLLPEYLGRNLEQIESSRADDATSLSHAVELPIADPLAEARYRAFVDAFVQVDQAVLDHHGGVAKYLVHKDRAMTPHAPVCSPPSSGPSKADTPKKAAVTLSGRAPSGRRRMSLSHSYQDPISVHHNHLYQDLESSTENPQRRLSMSGGLGVYTQSEDDGADAVKLEDSFDMPITSETLRPTVEDVTVTLALSAGDAEESLSAVVSKSAPASAGATAAAIMVDGDTITVAGLGDCEVFLVERRFDRNRTEADDDLVSASYGYPSICRHATLVVLPTGIKITKMCENHRMNNEKESWRLLHLFGPNIVRPLSTLPAPPIARRPSAGADDAVSATAPNARVRGKLAVTRAFGDYDIKLTVSDTACGRMLKDGAMLPPQPSEDTPFGDQEPLMSPLVLSNVPEVHTYKRGVPPPPGESVGSKEEGAIEHYDLVVVGCDGVWELESIAQIAKRADAVLQPILRARRQTGVSEGEWWRALETAMHAVITETLQNSIALSCSPDGKTFGGDNVSLLITLLL